MCCGLTDGRGQCLFGWLPLLDHGGTVAVTIDVAMLADRPNAHTYLFSHRGGGKSADRGGNEQ